MSDLRIQQITYYRVVKPPTLKQFLHRKFVKETMAQIKGKSGVEQDPLTGRPAPASAVKAREMMQGKKAEELMTEHPEWVEEYKKEYGDGTGNKEA